MSVTSKTRFPGRSALLALACAAVLSACTSSDEFSDTGSIGRDVLQRLLAPGDGDTATRVTPVELQQIAASTDLPVVYIDFANSRSSAALIEIERNGPVRTYATAARQTILLENGLARGTRGLGGDLMSTDLGTLPSLVAARRGGTTTRELRFLNGEDITERYRFACRVEAAPASAGVAVLTETCTQQNGPHRFTNSYRVDGQGRVIAAEQWFGPLLGTGRSRQIRF